MFKVRPTPFHSLSPIGNSSCSMCELGQRGKTLFHNVSGVVALSGVVVMAPVLQLLLSSCDCLSRVQLALSPE